MILPQKKFHFYEYDIILVDLNLPDGNGIQIIRQLKETDFKGGIIITSAKDTLEDRILGLNTGADDYLIKPFHLAELTVLNHSAGVYFLKDAIQLSLTNWK